MVLLLGITSFLITPNSSALSYQDRVDVQFTFNPSISLSVSGDLIIDNLAPGSSSDSNVIDVTVNSNNITGYVLTATAGNTSHADTDLTQSGVTNKFTSIATNASLSSLTTDDTWGYSFSSDTGSTWTNYSGLPLYTSASGAELASVNTNATTPIKFKIAAKASTTQVSGTYTNVINFIAVANPEPQLGPVACNAGYICYQPNSLTTVEGTMGEQAAADNDTITLLASNFSRTGYGFAGWSDVYDYETNQNAHFYGPQEDITVPTGTTANGTSLYAVWIKSQGSLQNQTKVQELCGTGPGSLTTAPTDGTANLSSVSALTDSRDNQTYAIAKLADGNCWMIENLRLEAENTRTTEKQALAQGYGTSSTYGNFSGLADAESANFANTTIANSLYYSGAQSGNATINIGTSWLPGYRMPRYNNLNTQSRASNPTSNSFTENNTTGGMYSYGNYYSWHAAIADTTHYNNGEHVITSLCPSGWRLPRGGRKDNVGVSDFWILSREDIGVDPTNFEDDYFYYTGTPEGINASMVMRSYPNNFLYSGYFSSSSAYFRGSRSSYWSSTDGDVGERSYYMRLSNSGVDPGTGMGMKWAGFSIRCMVGV